MDDLFKFSGDNVENVEKINLDELYQKKQEKDKNQLFTYNKILRVFTKKLSLHRVKNASNSFVGSLFLKLFLELRIMTTPVVSHILSINYKKIIS